MKIRSYSELKNLHSFDERLAYLRLDGRIGAITFGFDRWINQGFYNSYLWRNARGEVIARDCGCDLGIEGYEIHRDILVHHMNPMSPDDIIHGEEWIFDPNFLITTTKLTHNAIHYGNNDPYPRTVVTRVPNDTKLW